MDRGRIHPVVLAGGRSTRFGGDKLKQVIGRTADGHEEWLIDRPIAALRRVFGRRVVLVGQGTAEVAARGDGRIDDDTPGAGPLGGVLAALRQTGADVFVLAGDMPWITSAVVERVLDAAAAQPGALCVWPMTDRPQPCGGLYRQGAAAVLAERLKEGDLALHRAFEASAVVLVPEMEARAFANVNTREDLEALALAARNDQTPPPAQTAL